MHASTITATLLAGLSLSAMASPVSTNNTTEANLVRRANSCVRSYEDTGLYWAWNVVLDNDSYYNKKCGNGCLDNLRGRCGNVVDWGCSRDGSTGHLTFKTYQTCTEYSVTQALKACTKGEQTINCSD